MESGNEQPPTDSERADDERAGMERFNNSPLMERVRQRILNNHRAKAAKQEARRVEREACRMEQIELLQYVVRAIEEMGLRYFVTGSVATHFYGEPRVAGDIDVVVELPEQGIAAFCRRFPDAEFSLDSAAACGAVSERGQFEIGHVASGMKVDVIVPRASPFNALRFLRARRVRVAADFEAWFASPEDVIIKKMESYRQDWMEKHLRDIDGVIRARRGEIDLGYVEQWARQWGLADLWGARSARAGLPPGR
jgi:hypothetical protein